MIELLSLPFMQRALIGGIVVAILCAVLGIFVTLRRESFISDAVAHASLAGVAASFLLAIEPLPLALLVAVAMAVGITYARKNSQIATDSLIGIFYSIFFAVGILLLNLSTSYKPELSTYLFGSILAITTTDIVISLAVFLITTVIAIFVFKQLLYVTFDPEAAYIRGIKVQRIEYLITILASITVVISIKVVGIVLVTALLIIPATSARLIAANFRAMIPISIVQSVASVLLGIFISYFTNTSPGATIVIVSGFMFLVIFVLSRFRH